MATVPSARHHPRPVPADETAELLDAGGELPIGAASLGEVVIAHDYLNQRGGAERVVLELTRLFPDAPLLHLDLPAGLDVARVRRRGDPHLTAPAPARGPPLPRAVPALPAGVPFLRRARRRRRDLELERLGARCAHLAHASLHVVYCYTPARWLYTSEYVHGPAPRLRAPLLAPARRWDQRAAARADRYIAISEFVARRIRDVYGIAAPVVYPPVEVDRFAPTPRGERLLVVSRLLPYKRVDAIVAAATEAGIGLDVVGTGPDLDDLRAAAGPTVTFHGDAADAVVTELMAGCRALCLAGVEDFGMTPVEAHAAGKPVVAYGAGGALETVEEGVSGSFFDGYDSASVLGAIARCDRIEASPEELARRARRFAPERFREQLVARIAGFRDRFAA